MIRQLLLPARAIADEALLAREFPTVEISRGDACGEAIVEVAAWRSGAFDVWKLDEVIASAGGSGPFALRLRAAADDDVTLECVQTLTRAQWAIARRNRHSRSASFDAALARHRELHDLSKPLVHADWLHALDTWQWLLRLEPEAEMAAQIAALFHDVERLVSEADVRVEQHAGDYLAFKVVHAGEGARMVRALLDGVVEEPVLERAAALVRAHEQPGDDGELALLNDADALSFFSRNSAGYLLHFGEEQTRRKVDYTLRRMTARAREKLAVVRLASELEEMTRRWLALEEGMAS